MNVFWRFLRDKRNQQVLGWLGSGLVVAATGFWVAFVYFFSPLKPPEARSPELPAVNIQADCGGVAVGGNVTGATIAGGATASSDCGSKQPRGSVTTSGPQSPVIMDTRGNVDINFGAASQGAPK